jgi:hypothetical protein
MPNPYMQDEEDELGRRGEPAGYAQAANTAGNVAARPGFNPQMGTQARAPGDGKGPQSYSGMQQPQDPRAAASLSRAYGQSQQPAARPMPAQAQGNAYGQQMQRPQAAQAAAPAAAAAKAGGGMNPMLMAAIAQYMQGQQQKGDIARQGQQQIAQRYAASTGYPQAGVAAANTRAEMDEAAGPDYITELLKMRAQRGGR